MALPHDRFFKFVFGQPERAAELLSLALPQTVTSAATGELLEYFRGLVTYLLGMSTPEAEGATLKIVGTPAAREVIMTVAEKLRNEGSTEGRAEGTIAERREVLIRQLSKKFGLDDEDRILIKSTEDLARLAAALNEIVFAKTKQQILGKLNP